MSEGGVERPGTVDREYLIAHHFPDRYDRTLAVSARGRTYHFCARCSGQIMGFAVFLTAFFAVPDASGWLLQSWVLAVVALFPVLAAVDWLTQALGRRQSGNALRVVSGALLGAAFAELLALLVTARWELFLGGVLIFGLYIVALLGVLWATGGWRRILREHFPDWVPSAPP